MIPLVKSLASVLTINLTDESNKLSCGCSSGNVATLSIRGSRSCNVGDGLVFVDPWLCHW